MKKILVLVLTAMLIHSGFAQTKLKGNKNVVTQHRDIGSFNAILIKDNLDVQINESPNSKVSVETDENLQMAVETRVIDQVLEIYLSQKISKKKKLHIIIGVTDSIQKIEVRDNAKLIGENEIHCNDLTLLTQDNATVKMKFRLNNITITMDDRSDAEIDVSAKDDIIVATDNSSVIKLNATCDKLSASLSKSSVVKASGNCKVLEIIANDNGSFKGKNLLSDNTTVQATDRTDTYVNTSKELRVNIDSNAELYIYDEPKLLIEKFSDKATIFKK